MRRLVITHGERTIRQEVGGKSLVLGRDPACDLFFADQRLSRRHARFDPTPEGIRLEDLGSRNGCWIGSKRVTDVVLKPGDEALLGTLTIVFEEDTPPPPPSADDTATVVLDASSIAALAQPPPPDPDEEGTVILSPSASVPVPEPSPPAHDDAEATVLLKPSGEPAKKSALPDTQKTRVLDVGGLDAGPSGLPKTSILTPADRARLEPPPPETPTTAPEPIEEESAPGLASTLTWSSKLLVLTTALALVVYFVLAFPLMRTLGNALREESLRRGRVILDLLAAQNGTLVGEGRLRDLSVDAVLREERVKEALLIDLDGKVLAPSRRADGPPLESLPGIDASLDDIRTFYLGRRGNGDYVMVQPLLYQSRRVGLAVLVFEAASASVSWALAVLFLAFLVMMVGIVATLLFAKRMTLGPLGNLRDDVEAVIKGDADSVPLGHGFPELSELARSINRLVLRTTPGHPPPPRSSPSPSPAPVTRAPEPPAPRTPPITAGRPEASPESPAGSPLPSLSATEGARLWVDASFVIERAEEATLAFLGVDAGVEGKHVIEAVADQKLLEAILDAINALEGSETAAVTAELPRGPVSVRVAREGASVVVALYEL